MQTAQTKVKTTKQIFRQRAAKLKLYAYHVAHLKENFEAANNYAIECAKVNEGDRADYWDGIAFGFLCRIQELKKRYLMPFDYPKKFKIQPPCTNTK